MKKKKWWQEISIESMVKVIMACVMAFGGSTIYTHNRLNDFIAQVEQQNIELLKTIDKLQEKVASDGKTIRSLQENCKNRDYFL